MKILSIDWDYFVKCSEEYRALFFPDGGNENIGIALATFIWGSRYAAADLRNKSIEDVKVDEVELDKLRKILDKNKDTFYLIIADSHKHLGEFILDESMKERLKDDKLTIVNIDHHHDAFGIGDTLNCGNWVNKVIEAYPDTEIKWVGHEDSCPTEDEHIQRISMQEADASDYEVIYVCRSSVWAPPHLDKEFSALCRFVSKRAGITIFRQELMPRWDNEFKKSFKREADAMRHTLSEVNHG